MSKKETGFVVLDADFDSIYDDDDVKAQFDTEEEAVSYAIDYIGQGWAKAYIVKITKIVMKPKSPPLVIDLEKAK